MDDVRLRFPERTAEFDLGIELGALSVLMAQNTPSIRRQVGATTVDQLRPLAEHFRYVLVSSPVSEDCAEVSLTRRNGRPVLRLV